MLLKNSAVGHVCATFLLGGNDQDSWAPACQAVAAVGFGGVALRNRTSRLRFERSRPILCLSSENTASTLLRARRDRRNSDISTSERARLRASSYQPTPIFFTLALVHLSFSGHDRHFFGGSIDVLLTPVILPNVAKQVSSGHGMHFCKYVLGLLLAIDQRNARSDALFPEPVHELCAAVSLVRT